MLNEQSKMQLIKLLLSGEEKPSTVAPVSPIQSVKQIVIAQRGWVFLGKVEKQGDNLVIKDASVVRVWGTTKGLGELAKNGPIKDKTVLDACPDVTVHELAVVARINCEF